MDVGNDALKTAYRTTVIICISMVASVVVYIVVAEMLRNTMQWQGVAFSTQDALYPYLRIALLAFGIAIPIVVSQILRNVMLTPEKLANPTGILTSYSIIMSALCESTAIYGLVLFVLAGNIMDMYIFAAISLALFAVFFPRYSRWTELAGAQSGAPIFE